MLTHDKENELTTYLQEGYGGTWREIEPNKTWRGNFPREQGKRVTQFFERYCVPYQAEPTAYGMDIIIDNIANQLLGLTSQFKAENSFIKHTTPLTPDEKRARFRETLADQGISHQDYLESIHAFDMRDPQTLNACIDILNGLKLKPNDNSWNYDTKTGELRVPVANSQLETVLENCARAGLADALTLRDESWGKEFRLKPEALIQIPDYNTRREKFDASYHATSITR